MPFFSIVIPTYNRASFLAKGINSVLEQTINDWELIIIDDGSTDNTKEIVESYEDVRIKYIYQKNSERSTARNNGVKHSSGKWICFLDSDDYYLSNHLETLNNFISLNKEFNGLLLTGHILKKENHYTKHPLIDTQKNTSEILKEIWRKFILMNSVCVHHKIIEENIFNSQFRIWEDTHLWLRIAAQYPVVQLNQYTCVQEIHAESTVKAGMKSVSMKDVNQYITAINDLRLNYTTILKDKLTTNDFKEYIDSKYKMYLYQSRQNKQLNIALKIWMKSIYNNPSSYLLTELPKIFLNKLNIGISK